MSTKRLHGNTPPRSVIVVMTSDLENTLARYCALAEDVNQSGLLTNHDREEMRSYAVEFIREVLSQGAIAPAHNVRMAAIDAARSVK